MIEFFNTKKLLKIDKEFPLEDIKNFLENKFPSNNINIIFTNQREIKKLNEEFRSKEEVTDVLSFNLDSKNLLGEIYICPKYVMKEFKDIDLKKQILRLIIHGILHLEGLDHKKKFDKFDYRDEPMYIKQEELLNKFLNTELQK
jgi:probable rRNA maturation factor